MADGDSGEHPEKVVGLFGQRVSVKGEVNHALCQILTDLLAKAESGELLCLVATGFVADGGRLTAWADNHPNVYEMQGAISWLQHEYVARVTGQADTL